MLPPPKTCPPGIFLRGPSDLESSHPYTPCIRTLTFSTWFPPHDPLQTTQPFTNHPNLYKPPEPLPTTQTSLHPRSLTNYPFLYLPTNPLPTGFTQCQFLSDQMIYIAMSWNFFCGCPETFFCKFWTSGMKNLQVFFSMSLLTAFCGTWIQVKFWVIDWFSSLSHTS